MLDKGGIQGRQTEGMDDLGSLMLAGCSHSQD